MSGEVIDSFLTPELLDNEGYVHALTLTENVLTRWAGTIRPLPMPEHITPRGGVPLRETPMEALLNVAPQLIAHVQRTASQGGLQVVSPRQTPFCKTMIRHVGGDRRLGDHVVGSTANPDEVWPTIDDDDMSFLLPDEPLPSLGEETPMEPKTETVPLTKANKLLVDPVLSCLVKGRAVVDILRRDDINGDADGVLQLLAEAWGVPTEMLAELEAYTLGIEGSLQRHAIKVDEVYPMMYAPIHVRRCISMGCTDITNELLPSDTALDWKRMRVFCESVFALAMSIEGHVLSRVRCFPHPGDAAARTNRPGVLAFLPAPASAWTYAPSTFSICPVRIDANRPVRSLPKDVLESLTKYVNTVRPISHALEVGHRYSTRRATAITIIPANSETISECYRLMVSSIFVGGARGKNASRAIRNLIYETLESLPDGVRLRIARYMSIAGEMCKIFLDVDTVPDSVINKLAMRFTVLGEKIRSAVVAEAARRGSTATEWWRDVLAQSPASYQHFVEGSHGWARIALWLAFKGPTEKWEALIKAVSISALTKAAAGNVHGMPLPARKGSMERLIAAARHATKEITRTFASYYSGVADVGLAISDEAEAMNKKRTADILREGAYLWTLRARCFRGTNVDVIAHGEKNKSPNHFRIKSRPVDLVLVPAPYRAFEAYLAHVDNSILIPREVKLILQDKKGPVVSRYFEEIHRPIIVCKDSTITKYLMSPKQLARDIEDSWSLLVSDLTRIAAVYEAELEPPEEHVSKKARPAEFMPVIRSIPVVKRFDFYSTLGQLMPDQVDWVESVIDELSEDLQEEMYSSNFTGPNDLMAKVEALEREHMVVAPMAADTVH